MSTPFPVADGWWTQLYDQWMAEVILLRHDPAHTALTLDFLEERLQLSAGARVFDQCCGIGSLAIPLAQRGFEVVGVDLMPKYLERAAARADAASVSVELHLADAQLFVPPEPAKAAFNWATGFGYFSTDEDNLGMLRSAFLGLEPGGQYALDFMNVPQVLAQFRPVMVDARDTAYGPVVLTRHSTVGSEGCWLYKTWSYALPDGGQKVHRSRVRLYRPHQIAALMTKAGFVELQCFGEVDGHLRTDASPRCITIGRRP